MTIYVLPQPLSGAETVTIQQEQNGQMAECSMAVSEFLQYIAANEPELLMASLPSTLPSKAGIPWNNDGLLSIS
ncbi:hypothetical protein [Burkholderia sp. BE17]|uniref:hypothetical protein n=1 Tax=Burkholderia sp. BE17 TaxID=2656644 RepID=UPI00128BD779|nr:hypothetical protein [Burkholderia sp. BE17]MPV65845.1 hypothetical protein [Burkholderia sp. BE17]